LSLGVVIPTYQRPDWVRRAWESLARQGRRPDRVALVCRDTDDATRAAAEELARRGELNTEVLTVSEPGHIPPVEAGSRFLLEHCEHIAWLDDDAEAGPDWCARFLDVLGDPSVGCVAGRVRNHLPSGEPVDEAPASVFGRVDKLGRLTGNLYRPGAAGLTDVDFFMAGNVCFRAKALEALQFDLTLNRNVAFHYEVDLGLQLRAAGWRIVFDPENYIDHFSAPRANAGMRAAPVEGVRAAARNLTRIRLRRTTGPSRAVALAYGSLIGGRRDPGWLSFLPLSLQERGAAPVARFSAALRGRVEAYVELWRESK
jgi:GT2 family glycosyltransferase